MASESGTQNVTRPQTVERGTVRFFALLGIVGWMVATVVFRLVGQFLLDPANGRIVLGVFVATVPLMALVSFAAYGLKDSTGTERLAAAVALAVPGMLLDVLSTAFFETVFPNMDPDAAKYFGALLLLAYAVILLTGFVPQR